MFPRRAWEPEESSARAGCVIRRKEDWTGLAAPRRWPLLAILALVLLLLLAACGSGETVDGQPTASSEEKHYPWEATPAASPTPSAPPVDLSIGEQDIVIDPLPLRAGFPFTLTATIHNRAETPAADVPLMVYMAARQETIGYTSFLRRLTVTVPASRSISVTIPITWNFGGGAHQLWVQVNRLPLAWQAQTPLQPEENRNDNVVLLDLPIAPFDAYTSDLCPGRVDVEINAADILPEPDRQRVLVRVHNVGNQAVYHLPVVVTGPDLAGIAYTPAIPPCGGTAQVVVPVDRPLRQGESLTVQVNPPGWDGRLAEDDFDNNRAAVAAGLEPGAAASALTGLSDYDFSIYSDEITIPTMWIVQVTVHNQGTRDAAHVPIRIENEKGRKITDEIPLVRGGGVGVAAFRVGYLWIRGGTLTFTVNPADHKNAYPETNRADNVATFTLP
ncbi:MAG TPA: hypothetical protein ENJ31_11805 [Anaerolineae bacterium]|nr:hypothetical protein [Anaerolineae bacterium]